MTARFSKAVLFRTKYVSGVYRTLGINIIISARLKFLMKRCVCLIGSQPHRSLQGGGGRKVPNPKKTIIFMKEISSPPFSTIIKQSSDTNRKTAPNYFSIRAVPGS